MIAQKMIKYVEGSSVTRAMFEEGKKMAAQYGAENVYDFSLGNPSVEPPAAVKNAICEILEQESPCYVHGHSRTIVPDFKENVLSLFTNRQPQRRILIL